MVFSWHKNKNVLITAQSVLKTTGKLFDGISAQFAASAVLCFLLSLTASAFLPGRLSFLFDGPDKAIWVGPFIVFIGSVMGLYLFFVPALYLHFKNRESVLVFGATCLFASLIAFVALQRATSGLRVLESFNAVMSMRLPQGKSLYPDWEIYPTGTIYAPAYMVLTGLLNFIAPEFTQFGRIISLLSTIGTAWIIYAIILLKTTDKTASLWGSCLFLSTYGIMDTFYDIAMIDPFLTCLYTAALYFFLKKTCTGDFLSTTIMLVACFTKQTAVLPCFAVIVFSIFSKRRMWIFSPIAVAVTSGIVMLYATDGTAWSYLVKLPSLHGWVHLNSQDYLLKKAVTQLPLIASFVIGMILLRDIRFVAFVTTICLSSISGLLHAGGWLNVLIPFEAMLCIGAASAVKKVKLLLILQILLGLFNPFTAIYPWATIRNIDMRAVQMAKQTPGDVWFPVESELAVKAGKPEWDNVIALGCLTWAKVEPPRRLIKAIQDKRFDLILIRASQLTSFEISDPEIRYCVSEHYNLELIDGLAIFRPR